MPITPRMGSFVVFSIDTVASLAHLEDEMITAVCKEMCTKKYVAFVDCVRVFRIIFSANR